MELHDGLFSLQNVSLSATAYLSAVTGMHQVKSSNLLCIALSILRRRRRSELTNVFSVVTARTRVDCSRIEAEKCRFWTEVRCKIFCHSPRRLQTVHCASNCYTSAVSQLNVPRNTIHI